MTTAVQTVPDTARLTAGSTLQKLLPELVALTLHAKQAHWNLSGPAFLSLHALTDEIAVDSRAWADRVAERAVTLGYTVDARPGTVAAVARPFPAGRLVDAAATAELIEVIDAVASNARNSLGVLEEADVVAHDSTVEILEGLERYSWMLRAQSR